MEQARGELKAAKDHQSTGDYGWSCFASHQAAEKALKAVSDHLSSPIIDHDLTDYVRWIQRKQAVSEEVVEACSRLNKLYIRTRYYPTRFTYEETVKALEDAELVLDFARQVTGLTSVL